jgi:hypothetical protein
MDTKTFLIYVAMYMYGFSLMIWALFFDKYPTKTTLKGAKFGLIALSLTLLYFLYVLLTIGITNS